MGQDSVDSTGTAFRFSGTSGDCLDHSLIIGQLAAAACRKLLLDAGELQPRDCFDLRRTERPIGYDSQATEESCGKMAQ